MPRWKRALRLFAIALVALAALYVVSANLVLAVVLPRVLAKPSLTVEYRSAWSLWPGVVHASDLAVRGQTDTVDWMVGCDHAVLDIDLFALTHHVFHLNRLRGQGIDFRLRKRVDAAEAEDPEVAAVPPIAAYDPPIRDPAPPSRPPTKWIVQVDDSDSDVRQIWIGYIRFVGQARSRGAFYVAPHHAIGIPAARLDIEDGEVTLADHVIARAVNSEVRCSIDRFDPNVVRGQAILRQVNSDVMLDAQIPSIELLGFFVPRARSIFEDGSGALRAHVTLRQGRAVAGSTLELETDRVRVVTPSFEIVSDMRFDWRASDDGARTVASARATVASIWRLGLKLPPLTIADARASMATASSDLASPFGFGGFSARVARASVGDVRWLTGLREGKAVRLDAGRVTAKGAIDLDAEGTAHGDARMAIDHVELIAKDARLRGDLEATAVISGTDVLRSRALALVSGASTLSNASVIRGDHENPIAARADVDKGSIDLKDGFALHLDSHGIATETIAILDLLGAPPVAKAAAELFSRGVARATAKLAYEGDMFMLRIIDGESGATRVKGELRKRAGDTGGAFLVRSGPLSIGVLIERDDVTTVPEAADRWLEEHRPVMMPNKKTVEREP